MVSAETPWAAWMVLAIAETGRLAHVVGGQSAGESAAIVSNLGFTVPTDSGDGPAVAVFDPVGGGEPEPAVVRASDDHISDARLIAVRQPHRRIRNVAVEAMGAGASVEVGDEAPGGGEQDRVEASRPVGSPSPERVFGGSGEVADMHATMVQVELQDTLGVTVTNQRVMPVLRRGW